MVQETRPNQLEKVTYKWTTHFFEGIGETNLVLQPPAPTNRDGVLGGNSRFPNAYLTRRASGSNGDFRTFGCPTDSGFARPCPPNNKGDPKSPLVTAELVPASRFELLTPRV